MLLASVRTHVLVMTLVYSPSFVVCGRFQLSLHLIKATTLSVVTGPNSAELNCSAPKLTLIPQSDGIDMRKQHPV